MTVLGWQEKHALVASYARPYGLLVETGIYNGGGATTTIMGSGERGIVCYAIDLQPANIDKVRAQGVLGWLGDSALVLQRLLRTLDRPTCFWLDAHLASEGGDEEDASPLLTELDAILAWEHGLRSTILIDDLRMYGRPGWPTMTEVREKLGGHWRAGQLWQVDESDDILRATPHFPPLDPYSPWNTITKVGQ